jgi:RNA polymerase sigma factor (sigma-70 family)
MQKKIVAIDFGGHRERVLARRDELVGEHLQLVLSIARQVKRRLPLSFDLDDLIAAGNLALTHAATRYRPSDHNETPFSAFARLAIHGAMIDTVRRKAFTEATRPGLDDAPEPWFEPVIEICIDAGRLRDRLNDAIARLTPQHRSVLADYYGVEEPSLAVVATRIGLSPRRVGQLHAEAIDELRRCLRRA